MVSPAITDLRTFQWGKESAAAGVNLTVDTLPTAGDTFTIGNKVFTFVASGAAISGQVNVGVNLAAAQANILAAINGTDGWNTPHTQVTAAAFIANVMRITARLSGTDPNAYATTETFTAVSNVFSAVTLLGGLSKGTAVPATSKILVANWDVEPIDSVYHPPLLRGLIQRWKGGEVVIERGVRFTIPETPFFYEQAPNWLSQSVNRSTGLPTGAGPYVYTFTRDPTGNPDLDTWTYERRITDGVTPIDQEAAYCLLSSITWRGQQNQPVLFTAEGFGRRIQSSTLTAALTAPTAEAALSSSSSVYIDSSWANLGNTQIVGQILGWEIVWNTGYAPIFTTDGRADLDFTSAVISSENTHLTVRIRMLVKPNSGQFTVEQTAAEAQTLRAVRIQADGTSGRQCQWDMILKHNLGSLFKIGEFEGQEMIEMELVESTDATNLFRVKVTNNVSAMV